MESAADSEKPPQRLDMPNQPYLCPKALETLVRDW
jgi:hypothetical protein